METTLAVALVAAAEAAWQCSNSVTKVQMLSVNIFYTPMKETVISTYLRRKFLHRAI